MAMSALASTKMMTDPLVVLDDRDPRILHHEADQALAAAGDDEVDQLILLEHLQHPFPLGERDQRERCRRDAGALHLRLQDAGNGQIGV